MSVGFTAVQWNRRKIVYDAILVAGVVLFIGTFMTLGALRNPPADHAGVDQPAHQGVRHLRLRDAHHHPDDRAARATLPALPAAALQPPPFRRADVLRRARARVLGGRLVRRAGRDGRPDDRDDRQPRLRQVHRLPDQGARAVRPHGVVPACRDQPRFLARVPHPAHLEGAAHGALRRLRRAGDACGARADAGEPAHLHSDLPRRVVCAGGGAAHRRGVARARSRAASTMAGSRSARPTRSPTSAPASSSRRTASASRCSATATRSAR